ncbi:hypothetical protein GQ457_13G001700 [Hibiscus cannabinus]
MWIDPYSPLTIFIFILLRLRFIIYFVRYNDSRVKIGAVAGDYGKLLISIFFETNQRVHEVNHVYWVKKFEQFTDMVAYMLADKKQSFRPCGICTLTDHPTDDCPSLHEEQVYGVGNFPGPPQMPYDPYGNTYNSGWQDHWSEIVVKPSIQEQKEAEKSLNSGSQEGDDATTKEGSATPEPKASPYVAQPLFPVRFIEEDKRAKEKENLDVFRKGEVHIPLLEVIREMPRYAHFLKELCANTIKFSRQEKVNLGEHIFMVLTRRIPPKVKDMFAITRKIDKILLKEVLSWSKVQCLYSETGRRANDVKQ